MVNTADHRASPNPGVAGLIALTLSILAPEGVLASDSLGHYAASKGRFHLRNQLHLSQGVQTVRLGPKATKWKPLSGDWDGDGIVTLGLYDPSKGQFHLSSKKSGGAFDTSFNFGPKGTHTVPMSGDWDGDGGDGIGLYNAVVGQFLLKNFPGKGSADYDLRFAKAKKGWMPLVGNWSGEGVGGSGELALYLPGLEPIKGKAWNQTAVRQVLNVFAYGGQPTDQQIFTWAAMQPRAAIVEMLTFAPHNLELSPLAKGNTDRLNKRAGTLQGLSDFWSSAAPTNGVDVGERARYEEDAEIEKLWVRATLSRGLNPFRQRIGLWETNYHLAVNENVGVRDYQIVRYYDDIMNALARGEPYQEVLAKAATSAAIAMQYGHRKNAFVSGECRCNEDFAREYHQLFFGILGNNNPNRHETVTIKNTAKALTDMPVPWLESINRYADTVEFGTEFHYPGTLTILNRGIGGGNAQSRVRQLSQLAINHPESLAHLPVKIVSGLADDNLDPDKTGRLRQAWAAMSSKNLLDFLRAYAISEIFHHKSRFKLYTSVDRHLMMANRVTLSNAEAYFDLYGAEHFRYEDVRVFRPKHNVFGGQSGTEAADSATVFQYNWRRVTDEYWRYNRYSDVVYGRQWTKDWPAVIPRSGAGMFVVGEVGEWLWRRFVGDGLRNYGPLERAFVVSLLASDRDLPYLLDYNDLERIISSAEAANDGAIKLLVDTLAAQPMLLESGYEDDRKRAHERIGTAINFILGTPYVFAQEGR
jgi:hypothetical protein